MYEVTTYESVIVTTSETDQKTFVTESRHVGEHTISALRERSGVLDTAGSDVPINWIVLSRLSIFQTFDRIVAVSRKRDLEQALQIHTRDLVTPALGREIVQMSAKVPSPAKNSDTKTRAFCCSLYALTVTFGVGTSRTLWVGMFVP